VVRLIDITRLFVVLNMLPSVRFAILCIHDCELNSHNTTEAFKKYVASLRETALKAFLRALRLCVMQQPSSRPGKPYPAHCAARTAAFKISFAFPLRLCGPACRAQARNSAGRFARALHSTCISCELRASYVCKIKSTQYGSGGIQKFFGPLRQTALNCILASLPATRRL
jgi:hypothetical protein